MLEFTQLQKPTNIFDTIGKSVSKCPVYWFNCLTHFRNLTKWNFAQVSVIQLSWRCDRSCGVGDSFLAARTMSNDNAPGATINLVVLVNVSKWNHENAINNY